MADQDGNTSNIEGIFVFKKKTDATKFLKGLERELESSDAYASTESVDGHHIVFHNDHRVDEEELYPIGFDVSKSALEARLKKEVEDGDVRGVDSMDDLVFLKTN